MAEPEPAVAEAPAAEAEPTTVEAPAPAAKPMAPPPRPFAPRTPVVLEPVLEPMPPAEIAVAEMSIALAEASPVGESDLPPEPDLIAIVEGFSRAKPVTGSWKLSGSSARQVDPKQYYAKLAINVEQGEKPIAYAFKARSTGSGWVGLGIHVYARGSTNPKGYGLGQSILVWVTSDPSHRGDAATRVIAYRSLRDAYMEDVLGEAKIPESIFDEHEYRVSVQPDSGEIVLFVDGAERFRLTGLKDFSAGSMVALRALDMAEFSGFRVEAAR